MEPNSFGIPSGTPNDLRVIKTARDEQTINEAAGVGFWPLVQKVVQSNSISSAVAVYQGKKTGKIRTVRDRRFLPSYSEGEQYECVLNFFSYYPYAHESPFAAYLIPKDLAEGERVWLEDIIPDIVGIYGNQGYRCRLECCEATWEEGKFTIHWDPEKDAPRHIG